MDEHFTLAELAVAYRHLAYSYPVCSDRWHGYNLIARAYEAGHRLQAVHKRLVRLLHDDRKLQERFSPEMQQYRLLEEAMRCCREALTAMRHGAVVVLVRRISFRVDSRKYMDESFKLEEVAAAYRYMAYGYPFGAAKRHAYNNIAGAYDAYKTFQLVKERLEEHLRQVEQAVIASRIGSHQQLEEQRGCYSQALADLWAGSLLVPARRISFCAVDGRE